MGTSAPTEIAILPFETVAGDLTTRAFADGVAETVAGVMAKADLPTFSLDANHAASALERDAIAVKGGAAYALGGRVDRDGQNLKVTVNVSDPRKHEVLWSTRFTRAASEASPMQDQVATTTARVLQCAFDIIRFPDSRFDQETVALYLRACEVRTDWDAQDQERDLLRKVVKRQPRFAMGWAKLAIAFGMAGEDLPPDQAQAAKTEATADAARAIRLDPKNGLPYFALAYLVPTPGHLWERHSLLMKGLALSPDNGVMNFKEGEVLGEAGRTQEALAYYRRAVSLDPLNPTMRFELGVALSSSHTEEARSMLDQAISIWPDDPHLRIARIALEARYGDPDKALAMLADPAMRPANWEAAQIEDWRRFPLVRKSRDPKVLAAYQHDELEKLAAGKTDVSTVVVRLASLGDADGTFAAASRATPDDPLDTEPLFRPAAASVRKDPRFMPLAVKAGLVDFWRRTGKWADFCDAPDRPYDCRAEAAKLKFALQALVPAELGAAHHHVVHLVRAVGEAQVALRRCTCSASGVHCEMPVAPWIWIAWSMIWQTRSGTMALTMLTQTRASRLPSTSMALAALSTIRRMASISMRARETVSRFLPSWISGLPKASRVEAALDHQVQRPLGLADGAHAVVDAARAQAHLGDLEAAALAEQDVLLGHPHIVEAGCACGRAARDRGRTPASGPSILHARACPWAPGSATAGTAAARRGWS